MKKLRFCACLGAIVISAAIPALGYWTPLQINLAGDAGLPPAASDVYGLRANALFGSCESVVLFDVGVFNRTKQGAYGIRAGLVNWAEGEAYGLTAGAFNFDKHHSGFAAGCINYAQRGGGVQIGVINIAEEFTGLQVGALNFHFNSVIPIFPLFNMGSK